MSRELLHYKGVYGEQEQPFRDAAVHIEPLISRSKVHNFDIEEHLHADLVQIFILEKGGGQLLSEGKKIDVDTPCVIIIPNGVLHGFVWQTDLSGTVITVSLPFYESSLREIPNTLTQFGQLKHFSFLEEEEIFKELLFIAEDLGGEVMNKKPEKQIVIEMLIKLFMVKLYRKSIAGIHKVISNDNRTLNYFNAFQKEILNSIDSTKKISDYAKILNITPVHLNRICRSLVQKTALQIVHEKLITESKKYLLYTNKTVSEIAYSLNFKDPSHFSKFFKKYVNVSPRRFRQSQTNNINVKRTAISSQKFSINHN